MRAEIERLLPAIERAKSFSGWKFDIDVRHLGPPLPWDYPTVVRELAPGARAVVDMGTGGGERLAELRDALPGRTVATEEWHVNAPVANERLRPLDVDVVRANSLRLPFPDGAFDLVLNRHEELDPAEVARVLAPGGSFVTQQVGYNDWQELKAFFPRMRDFGDLFGEYRDGFERAGLDVLRAETHDELVAYAALEDFVLLLAVTDWLVQDLDLERDGEALLALEEAQTTSDGLVMTESRFLIAGRKPD